MSTKKILLYFIFLPLFLFSQEKIIKIETDPKECDIKIYEKTFTVEGKGQLLIEGKSPLDVHSDILEKVGRKGVIIVVSKEG